MAKTYREGQLVSSRGLKKVPLGTVVRYEPHAGYDGACSIKTPHHGWVSQYGLDKELGGHDRKVFRILCVGSQS